MAITKYVIIGFGGIAENRIAKEGFALDSSRFEPLENIKLIGATDLDLKRKNAAEELGLKWYNSVDEICADDNIDAVFIATNNLSHYAIAKQLIEAKKHLIIEKPIATTIEHAESLIELADKHNVSLAVDHMMINNSYNIKAQELIASGAIGKVNDIVLHMEFPYGYTPEERATWRISNPAEVGGPIGDVASHCFYMAEFLLNDKIESVSAVYTPEVNKLNVENGAFIRFNTTQGINGSIRVSFSDLRGALESLFLNLGYEVYGSSKTIRTYGTLFQFSGYPDEPIQLRLEVDDFNSVANIKLENVNNIYSKVIKSHSKSIQDGKRMNGTDALHNLKLILKAHETAKNNCN